MLIKPNLVPRALFPGFGGGAAPKPGKSPLGTRLPTKYRRDYEVRNP